MHIISFYKNGGYDLKQKAWIQPQGYPRVIWPPMVLKGKLVARVYGSHRVIAQVFCISYEHVLQYSIFMLKSGSFTEVQQRGDPNLGGHM